MLPCWRLTDAACAGRAVAAAPSAAVAAGAAAAVPSRGGHCPPTSVGFAAGRSPARPHLPDAAARAWRRAVGASRRLASCATARLRCRADPVAPLPRLAAATVRRATAGSSDAIAVAQRAGAGRDHFVALGKAAEDLDDDPRSRCRPARSGRPPCSFMQLKHAAPAAEIDDGVGRDAPAPPSSCRVVMPTRAYMPGFSR